MCHKASQPDKPVILRVFTFWYFVSQSQQLRFLPRQITKEEPL